MLLPSNTGKNPVVKLGCRVRLEFLLRSGKYEQAEFRVVPDTIADITNGSLGVSTQLAKTIINVKTGIPIPFFTEDTLAVKILEIESSENEFDISSIDRNNDSLERIKAEIEFREALLFASSANTKWGSYDPDGLDMATWNKTSESSESSEDELSNEKDPYAV